MQARVDGIYHLYFGDATKHPIIGNYLRSLPDLPQKIVLDEVPPSRWKRFFALTKALLRYRKNTTWALQCHDVMAGVIGALFWKGRLIYDSHEVFSSFAPNAVVSRFIRWLELFTMKRADVVIFPSRFRAEHYPVNPEKVRIVENLFYPYDTRYSQPGSQVSQVDYWSEAGTGLRFVYTGLFTPARAIDCIVAAFDDSRLKNHHLILAGKRTDYLDEVIKNKPENVSYIGELPHADACDLLRSADAGFALYRPINENNRRCAPTKIFEFLYFGVHAIVNDSPYILEIRNRTSSDYLTAVESITSDAIVEACLAIPEQRRMLTADEREAICWESQLPELRALYI